MRKIPFILILISTLWQAQPTVHRLLFDLLQEDQGGTVTEGDPDDPGSNKVVTLPPP